MKTTVFKLLLLSVLLSSCNAEDDDQLVEITCKEDNNMVSMTRFVKSEKKSNWVNITYNYNELNLLSYRKRSSPSYVFETEYVYDCRNNIIEINTEETADPQRGGSNRYYTYDVFDRLTSYRVSFQGEFDYHLSYEANIVTVEGTIWNDQNATIELHLNDSGAVERLNRISAGALYSDVTYTLFDYDDLGNMIQVNDYGESDELINSIGISYDQNINPYVDQLKSIYLEKFINLFYHSGYWAADVISGEGLTFPYTKNNIETVVDNICNACYPEISKRIINYDEQVFPKRIVQSYWGAPGIEVEIDYYD